MRARVIVKWDQQDLALGHVPLDSLNLNRWNQSIIRVVQNPRIPPGTEFTLYEQTFLAVQLDLVDESHRLIGKRLG